jgi:hypothetical protein
MCLCPQRRTPLKNREAGGADCNHHSMRRVFHFPASKRRTGGTGVVADNWTSYRSPSCNGRRCFLPPPSGSPKQMETSVRFGDPLLTADHDAAILLVAMVFGPKLGPGTAVFDYDDSPLGRNNCVWTGHPRTRRGARFHLGRPSRRVSGQEYPNLCREEAPEGSDQGYPTGGLDLTIVSDSELVKQAAQDLLADATRFIERGKKVRLSRFLVNNGAVIELSDQRLAVLARLGITSATLGGSPHF